MCKQIMYSQISWMNIYGYVASKKTSRFNNPTADSVHHYRSAITNRNESSIKYFDMIQ